MNLHITLSTLSLTSIMILVGCGGSDNNTQSTQTTSSFSKTFKTKSIHDQVEELMGGVIGIADEVGHGKMGDPMTDSLATADTTKVESQFSWNSTKDFYDNIYSIKKVWDAGLGDIARGVDAAKATQISVEIDEALSAIVAISDQDGDGILEASDISDGTLAFRNQIKDVSGRTKIASAQAKLESLQGHLEALKPRLANATLGETDKTKVAGIVDNVIVAGYTTLTQEANKLVTVLSTLKESPTAVNITAARDQWRATRSPWESGEGHIFGPVDTLGVDPKVDSWPVDKNSLDGALGGYDATLSNIDGFPTTMKGFHAIEYMLFGDGTMQESAQDASSRLQTVIGDEAVSEKARLGYLKALGVSFSKDIKALSDAWTK